MTGVEILATEEVVIATAFNWVIFFIVTFVFMAVFALVGGWLTPLTM